METSPSSRGLDERDVDEILAYVRIAELHGAPLSLADALRLTSVQLSEEGLAEAWERTSSLSSLYPLLSGQIVPKANLAQNGTDAFSTNLEESRRRVEANVRVAKQVERLFAWEKLRMFSVSGTNSYDFARGHDDIDLFCITRNDTLWLFMLKALLVVRFYEFFRKDLPRLCFSYVVDEANARKEFRSPKDRLFARDALNLKVISGQDFYLSLMADARWMQDWFPRIYRMAARPSSDYFPVDESSSVGRIINRILYRVVGPYLRLKSILDNAKNGRRGKAQFVNRVRIGEGYILHESKKYQELRGLYQFEMTKGRASYDGAHSSFGP
ncbi:MAG: hypothetical protein LYZ70_00865 [Nitrososphaerales archaeon]|nr:hypothetical protein [Nitrososphaerales archaeon]